jgi:hypothetical protein
MDTLYYKTRDRVSGSIVTVFYIVLHHPHLYPNTRLWTLGDDTLYSSPRRWTFVTRMSKVHESTAYFSHRSQSVADQITANSICSYQHTGVLVTTQVFQPSHDSMTTNQRSVYKIAQFDGKLICLTCCKVRFAKWFTLWLRWQ